MSAREWPSVVFRLQNIPNGVTHKSEAASLVAGALGLAIDQVTICSLARTFNFFELESSQVATIQLKSVPAVVQRNPSEKQWTFPLPNAASGEPLLLDTHFKGMTVLNDVDASLHRADCIAISGLASHPFGSWQPRGRDKDFMWIRDSIPKAIPHVRTIIYGYDSELGSSSSFQSISQIAQTLIWRLRSGGWTSSSSKPIIFLAHSLGGLVLKDAIVQMADREQSTAEILDKVHGIIMFGVPSLGMKQSALMDMVRGQPNELLVHDLSRENGASYIRQLSARFEGLAFLRTTKILWAFETKESPTVMKQADGSWARNGSLEILVDPESATYHNLKNKSVTIPINQDHSSMVKFSRGDPDLNVILHAIAQLCPAKGSGRLKIDLANQPLSAPRPGLGATTNMCALDDFNRTEEGKVLYNLASLMSSLDELYDNLYLPELSFRASQIEDPFQDTFKWIFDLPMFSSWLQEGTGLFWIRGKPGSGKSTLMKLISESERTRELLHNWDTHRIEVQASFFFHYRGSAMQKSFEGLLRSLITQILTPHLTRYRTQHGPVCKMYHLFQQHRERREWILTELEATIQAIGNAEKMELEFDMAQGAGKMPQKLEDLREKLEGLKKKREALETELPRCESQLRETHQSLVPLATSFMPHSRSPTTLFLSALVAEHHQEGSGLITKMERILRLLLDQNVIEVDLVLFFDALDEFDGHISLLSRFLKIIIQPAATSSTRVRVCFSSRPSEHLQDSFSNYPGFQLQDYTKHDIEEYAAGVLAGSDTANSSILRLVPKVLSRADGVFLWVRLALQLLLETIATCREAVSLELLEQKLQKLPDDLFEFYKLIIERIGKQNRRRTFALLDLLIRHQGSMTASQLRDAVVSSWCATYQEAISEISRAHIRSNNDPLGMDTNDMRVRQDILTWGGGLVEIKGDTNNGSPQLMHQTVLEFAMSMDFKRIVLGHLADVTDENGHSFHMKYWSTTLDWPNNNKLVILEALLRGETLSGPRGEQQLSDLHAGFPREAYHYVGYHAERSELTTGKSHYEFLDSMFRGRGEKALSFRVEEGVEEAEFVTLVCSYGLNLCLRDFIARRQSPVIRFSTLMGFSADQTTYFALPIVWVLMMAPPWGVFDQRYLSTMQLLLENGYQLLPRENFFACFARSTWGARLNNKPMKIRPAVLLMLAALALDSSAQSSTPTPALLAAGPAERTAIQVLRRGVNPNATDSTGRTLLDWASGEVFTYDPKERYELCSGLLKMGARMTEKTATSTIMKNLRRFQKHGLDISDLLTGFATIKPDCTWEALNMLQSEGSKWPRIKSGLGRMAWGDSRREM